MKRLIVCCDGTWNRPDRDESGRRRADECGEDLVGARGCRTMPATLSCCTTRPASARAAVNGSSAAGSASVSRATSRIATASWSTATSRGTSSTSSASAVAHTRLGAPWGWCATRDPAARAPTSDQGGVRALSPIQKGQRAERHRGRAVPAVVLAFGDLRGLRRRLGHRRRARHPDRRLPSPAAEQAVEVSRHRRSAATCSTPSRRLPSTSGASRSSRRSGCSRTKRKDQTLEQVWFSGVHCDVGGGYRDRAFGDPALCGWPRRPQLRACIQARPPGRNRDVCDDLKHAGPGFM